MPKSSNVFSQLMEFAKKVGGPYLAAFLKADQAIVNAYVNIKTETVADELFLNTVTVKAKGKAISDDVLKEHPELVAIVPRCFSYITNRDGDVLGWITGPEKFGGLTELDDDDGFGTVNLDAVKKAAADGKLQVIRETKANGEFAACKFYLVDGEVWVIGGSKNSHRLLRVKDIPDHVKKAGDSPRPGEKLVNLILLDIHANLASLLKLIPPVELGADHDGPTLCGEFLGEGRHFVPVDESKKNTIDWWALCIHGRTIPPTMFHVRATEAGVKTVDFETILSPSGVNQTEELGGILSAPGAGPGEGDVLYFVLPPSEPGADPTVVLAKNKKAGYIVLRFLRQQIMASGADCLPNLAARFVDAASYHLLGTRKCVWIYGLFVRFIIWMFMDKGYPQSIFNFLPGAKTRRGEVPAMGFAMVFDQFLCEQGETFEIKPEDFGPFNAADFLANVSVCLDGIGFSPNPIPSTKVLFFQGIQGTGKSTFAGALKDTLAELGRAVYIVEQDWFYGCGQTTLNWFQFLLKYSRADYVLVSRCNASPEQYNRYLSAAQALGNPCLFVSLGADAPTFAAALRSCVVDRQTIEGPDKVTVGRESLALEELFGFVPFNMVSFEVHPDATPVSIYDKVTNEDLIEETCAKLKTLTEKRMVPVKGKGKSPPPSPEEFALCERLVELGEGVKRRSVAEVVRGIAELLLGNKIPPARLVKPLLTAAYYISSRGRDMLFAAVGKVVPVDAVKVAHFSSKNLDNALSDKALSTLHGTHVTAAFFKDGGDPPAGAVPPGKSVNILVTTAVVMETSVPGISAKPGAIAVRARVVDDSGKDISPPGAHITIVVPPDGKASDSRGFVALESPVPAVRVVPLKAPLTLEGVSVWKAKSR